MWFKKKKKSGNYIAIAIIAMMTIGEGFMAMLFPKSYVKVWHIGPPFMRNMAAFFIARPLLTKFAGFLESIAGFWIGATLKHRKY